MGRETERGTCRHSHPAQPLTSHPSRGPRAHPVEQSLSLTSPAGSAVKNPPEMQQTHMPSLGWEDPLQKAMATPVFLCRKTHGQSSLVDTAHRVTKLTNRVR